MCRVLFSIGRFSISSYGLMIALGVLLGYYWVKRRGTQCGIQEDFALDLALRLVLIGFLGGKILYVFTNWQNFLHEPLQYLGSSGFVVYGGILAGLAAAWSYCRRREVAFSAALDVFLPPVALAQAFGRVGCFLTGCCYGRPTQSRIGVVFPEGCSAPAGVPLIPTQLFSAAGDLLIVCLLLVYERRKAAYRTLAPTYFFLYGTGRFCIEFLRDDPRGSVGALSTSQFISVFVVILSAVLYWWEGRKHQKAASHP